MYCTDDEELPSYQAMITLMEFCYELKSFQYPLSVIISDDYGVRIRWKFVNIDLRVIIGPYGSIGYYWKCKDKYGYVISDIIKTVKAARWFEYVR